ncbi:inositol monophosphatase family protein [Quadrisphaera sp. DSM 44207]|uniref:inositol monophosphatase family protein n=1 Tax=Quadrisphaera sp. DSM 44207 TaxID=1881057 RepID=UPI000888BE91|nr:inositol monophosphatase family protein [Quadrisphaera sp. DSM 44207]SDQ50275.1 myo-inositol-1(or 4)-monophosphatase [Quadrisphaera sp. DSM 44207]
MSTDAGPGAGGADPGELAELADPGELAGLAGLAEAVARAAGDLVRDQRPDDLGVAATKSSATDVVTAMDTAAEELVRRELARARPDDGLLGEEGGLRPGRSGLTWVVDPIDGTVNYLYRIPAYAVSLAVVSGDPHPARWTALAGCVHNPATGETWTAARGAGARLDGRLLGPVLAPPLERALVGTGFGYTASRRAEQAAVVAALLPRVRDVRRIGSSALDLCAVASGRLDAYYERGLNPWDLAAGALVVTEAGGAVTGLRGAPADERMLVAAAPGLADALGAELAALGA